MLANNGQERCGWGSSSDYDLSVRLLQAGRVQCRWSEVQRGCGGLGAVNLDAGSQSPVSGDALGIRACRRS